MRSPKPRRWTTRLLAASLLTFALGCDAFSDVEEVPRPACGSDAQCSDGVFCNGAEVCDPQAPDADSFGCVASGADALLDDGVACTVDVCDEEARRVLHDASACPCLNDAQCAALNPGPCVEQATCDPETSACVVTLRQAGQLCDDGITCTIGTTCDADGACVGTPDDGACGDGIFCNGAEACDPQAPGADPLTGCALGVPVVDDPAFDDGVDCTATTCDEASQSVGHAPGADCACQVDEDCVEVGSCLGARCAPEAGFTCQPTGTPRPEGSACDDGLACTSGDVCQPDGVCLGEPVNTLCGDGDACNGQERCAPGADDADARGCVPGEEPTPPCP